MFYVYVLLDKNKNFYSGYSNNLKNRIKEHNEGKVFATKSKLPVTLIYYEACLNKYDALKREKFFKSGPGRRFIKSRLKNYLKYIKKCQRQVRSTVLKALDLKVRFAV